jgi:hypothetical protein
MHCLLCPACPACAVVLLNALLCVHAAHACILSGGVLLMLACSCRFSLTTLAGLHVAMLFEWCVQAFPSGHVGPPATAGNKRRLSDPAPVCTVGLLHAACRGSNGGGESGSSRGRPRAARQAAARAVFTGASAHAACAAHATDAESRGPAGLHCAAAPPLHLFLCWTLKAKTRGW